MNRRLKKYTIKEVKKIFKDGGCKLLGKVYINCETPMRYICECKEHSKISLSHFRVGGRCKKCGYEKIAEKQRLKFKDVKQYFEDHDCELLETEYVNNSTPMKYRCDCGNPIVCKITFSSFSQGRRCKECGIRKQAESHRYTFEEVKQYFKDHGCELLETEYINAQTKMRYLCENKHLCEVRFASFKYGTRCIECSGTKKLTFEFVKQYFEEQGCELLETEYINNRTPMKYRCICKNDKCKIRFDAFKRGGRCEECGVKRKAEKQKHSIEYVRDRFKEHGYELLDKEYKNARALMWCFCPKGHLWNTTYGNFKSGHGCKECAVERHTGEGSPRYNHNLTDEERENNGNRPGCNKWRKLILERDKNTCQCCFQVEVELIAHHIENYANNKELGTVVSNGFLFCEKHHKEFHKKYGNNCNREQLNEFLKIGVV